MRTIIAILAASCALLPGCVRTPQTDIVTKVPVHEVVRRLKCELVKAVDEKLREDRRFHFLTQWAAKVHLTLVVDDMASINPGATFIEPLAVTGTSRSLAVGGGLTTEAVRTEDIEFFMSFSEIFKDMSVPRRWEEVYHFCERSPGLLLESELGFKETLDRALAPVGAGILYTGVNNPGIGSGQPKVPADEMRKIQSALETLKNFDRLPGAPLSEVELSGVPAGKKIQELQGEFNTLLPQDKSAAESRQKLAQKFKDNLAKARLLATDTRLLVNDVVTPLFDIANNSIASSCMGDVTKEKYAAVTNATVVYIKKVGVDNAQDEKESDRLLSEEKTAATEVYNQTEKMLTSINNCGPKEKAKPSLYDPIDVIGETLNFYITASGSVTPIWKLVRLTAPLSSTFVSAQRKDTDTLILALGRPASTAAGTTSSAAMDQTILSRILSQAITTSVSQSR